MALHAAPPSSRRAAPTPLGEAYARLTAVFPGLRVLELTDGEETPRGNGWIAAADLAAGGVALDGFLEWDGAQLRRDYGQEARPDVIASLGLHRYAWAASLLITVPWFLCRRVPRPTVADVSVQRTHGRMAVRARDVACLPGDPVASLPGIRVVADEEALRNEVREATAGHLGPILDAFGPRMRRGRRALWGMATDEVVEGLWHIARLLGEERRATAELEALLPGGTGPYVGAAGFRELTGPAGGAPTGPSGGPPPTRDRVSCCLFYTLHPTGTCATCPRTCDAERNRRLGAS
ncbi:(2Fe-2S)-binding protein [Streptomyces sp. NPDC059175]|uniref:(2Fe-2S)-binding protein n=1 Tax=unclassified Streptomyces TaxID=2593676 RepID=UPI0036B94BE6